jgi:branched-chain amino acid transport system substrate-binding protein
MAAAERLAEVRRRASRPVRCRLCTVFLLVLLILSPFVLAGCRVVGSVRPTVKIGLVAPFEGRYRYVGYDLFPAVRLALREVNASGGVRVGTRLYGIELVAYDDGADPEMAVLQARKLALDPDVIAVIGHFREDTTRAALPVYAEAGLALVSPGILDPTLGDGSGVVLRPGAGARDVAAALLAGLEAAALVDEDGSLSRALQEEAEERGVALGPSVSPRDPEWLDAILADSSQSVLCDADPVTAGEVVAALRGAGWPGTFLGGPELAATDFAGVAGDAAEGALFVTPWPLPGTWAESRLPAAYVEVSGGPQPGPLAWPAYEAVGQVVEALEADLVAHGTPSRAGVASALARSPEGGTVRHGPLHWYRIAGGGVPQPFEPDAP